MTGVALRGSRAKSPCNTSASSGYYQVTHASTPGDPVSGRCHAGVTGFQEAEEGHHNDTDLGPIKAKGVPAIRSRPLANERVSGDEPAREHGLGQPPRSGTRGETDETGGDVWGAAVSIGLRIAVVLGVAGVVDRRRAERPATDKRPESRGPLNE